MRSQSANILREAELYRRESNKRVLCTLCPHTCLIDQGKRGLCQVRENIDGSLFTHAYGYAVVQNVDAIEKKPLYHFYPGSKTYSIATHGCNFHCQYCTNWQVSQQTGDLENRTPTTPERIVSSAMESGCQSIAYTYVEPTIFFEYVHEISVIAKSSGLKNIFKTNGFMSREMLEMYGPYLDAANVDLKTFREKTYKQFGGQLQPVLESLRQMKQQGTWVEVTTVVIPGLNDDERELEDIARFIASELGVETPWHIARFFPAYQMADVPPTPVRALHKAYSIGLNAGLHHVYLGNLLEAGKQDTYCPVCNYRLAQRHGFKLLDYRVQNGCCPDCNYQVAGIGLAESYKNKETIAL